MKSYALLSVTLAICGALVAAGGCSRPVGAEAASRSTAAPLDRVTAGKPQQKTLTLYTSQPARIEAFESTPLLPKLAGYVEKVSVDIGDSVKQGQSLIVLSIPELQDDLELHAALVTQAEAEVQQAKANVVASQAAYDTATAKIEQAEAGIGRAEGEHARWQAEHVRLKELAARGSVTQKLADETLSQLQAADAARREAAAAVRSAQAAAEEAQAKIRQAQTDKVAAEAQVRVAKANQSHAKTMVGYADIKSPFDGVVIQRSIDTGHYVQPGGGGAAKPLLEVARIDKVRVFVDVPEMEAALVDVGDPAKFRVQALHNKELEASVSRTSWSLDGSNRSLRVEFEVPNEQAALRPGMYALATILLDQRENAVTLPTTAIVRDGNEAFCCCVESGKIDRRKVELGLRSGPEVEVLAGVNENDTVVLARAESLQQGQAVDVIKPE
ncbi:MAG: efflux RND transporter periplasmic adaptor subunit [Pirellulales bacterium]